MTRTKAGITFHMYDCAKHVSPFSVLQVRFSWMWNVNGRSTYVLAYVARHDIIPPPEERPDYLIRQSLDLRRSGQDSLVANA